MSDPYPGTKSALRAISVLKAFSDERSEWGLSELADEVGLNKTTTYRLLTALKSEGLVTQNPQTQGYRLGPAIIALGARALRSNDIRSASRPHLEQLASETGETATLEVLVDETVLILDEVLGAHLIGTNPSIGTRWPAHATSTGRLLMAYLPQDRQTTLLEDTDWTPLTDRTMTESEALRRECKTIGQQGYALVIGELEADFVAIAAPIRNLDGEVVAAISIGGPRSRLTDERIADAIPLVRDAGDRISQRLGYYQ